MTGACTAVLPSSPLAPAQARAFALRACGELLPEPVSDHAEVVDGVELVISELVTNAVRAVGGEIRLAVELNGRCLRVSVGDELATLPRRRVARPVESAGRGLAIVASLARSWGTRPDVDGPGKTVWAELALLGAGAHRDAV